jgi:hypothetical protein
VDDLPDAVAALEAADEEDRLWEARAGQDGAKGDVDDDGAPPGAGAAFESSLAATRVINGR